MQHTQRQYAKAEISHSISEPNHFHTGLHTINLNFQSEEKLHSNSKMSTPTDNKDEQKIEPQYLTLADKQPSLIRGTGTDSGRTISTRQLSDNLQTTRDGLINLMRNREKNDKLQRSQGSGSDDEDNAAQGFGMPVRSNRTGTKKAQYSLHEITNKKWKKSQRGEFGSEEFDPSGVNRFSNQHFKDDGSNSNMEKWGSKNGQVSEFYLL